MSKPSFGEVNADRALGSKDAFHMPCILVSSKEKVLPGERLILCADQKYVRCAYEGRIFHGIADPFITEVDPYTRCIPDGQSFWMLLSPDMTGNLSHDFEILGVHDGEVDVRLGGEDDDDWCRRESC